MNKINKQYGVALVQVLLITAMLLILTVELSKGSRAQIKTAIALKDKAELVLQARSLKEEIKFDLLVSEKNNKSGFKGTDFRFDGTPLKRDNSKFTMQDEDGLVSTVYGGDYIKKVLGGDERRAKMLAQYQGIDDRLAPPPDIRNGPVPSLKELRLLPAGGADVSSNELTQLPTLQFNLFNSPKTLLGKLFNPEVVSDLMALKEANNAIHSDWTAVTGRDAEYDVSFLPGNYLTLTITANQDDMEIVRKTRLMMNFDLQPFMAEIVTE